MRLRLVDLLLLLSEFGNLMDKKLWSGVSLSVYSLSLTSIFPNPDITVNVVELD